MILDRIFSQNNIIETAMQASMVRNNVIINNIANAETPGFKKSAVFFEDALDNALRNARDPRKPDLNGVEPVPAYFIRPSDK